MWKRQKRACVIPMYKAWVGQFPFQDYPFDQYHTALVCVCVCGGGGIFQSTIPVNQSDHVNQSMCQQVGQLAAVPDY